MADTKLTLRLDAGVIGRAKAEARRRGTTLSDLVEGYFDTLAPDRSLASSPEVVEQPDLDGAPLTARLAARPVSTVAGLPATPADDRRLWQDHLDRRHG